MSLTWALTTGMLASLGSTAVVPRVAQWTMSGVVWAVCLAVLLRLGVAAMIASMLTLAVLVTTPRDLDLSAWHQTPGRIAAVLIVLLALYGFRTALAGRRVLRALP